MSLVPDRSKVLFLPVIRGGYDRSMTVEVKEAVRKAATELGIDGIFPADDTVDGGLVMKAAHVREYWQNWRNDIADIKALIVFSSDFMQERSVMDTVRLLPEDVPVFLMVNNDDPTAMVKGKFGDSLCGSLSVHHNVRMLGRCITRSCRIDMNDADCLKQMLRQYVKIADGIETLRNMRVAMIGVNPDAFATTFVNQMELFRLGFSLHTYELLDLWGDVVLGAQIEGQETEYEAPFGTVRLDQPVRKDDSRLVDIRERMAATGCALAGSEQERDTMARCLLWVQSIFERDYIDAGAIHCWSQFWRYFPTGACGFAMLSNLLLGKPVVCEVDVCHAIMARLAWVLSGEPGVILDINNNGWDARVFNVFHCSQTPPNWLIDGGEIGDAGAITGRMRPELFTAVSAATSSDAFHATIFTGRFLREDPGLRGSSGWAFVPNFADVLEAIEGNGIHHFVAMKGDLALEVAEALHFRGLEVNDMSCEVGSQEEAERDLPGMDDAEGGHRVYSC